MEKQREGTSAVWKRFIQLVTGSIKVKMLIMMIAILLSTVLSIGFFSYTDTSRTIRTDVEQFSSQILRQANLHLGRYLQEYDRELLLVASGSEFAAWQIAEKGDKFEQVRVYQQVTKNYTQSMFSQHPEILAMHLYRADGNELHFTGTIGMKRDFTIASEPHVLKLVDDSLYGIAVIRTDAYYHQVGEGTKTQPVLSLIRKFPGEGSPSYLRMDVSLEPIIQILQEIEPGRAGLGVLVDASGSILAHPREDMLFHRIEDDIQRQLAAAPSGAFLRGSTDEMIVYRNIPGTSWTSLVIVPYKEAASSIYRVRNVTIAVACIGLVLSSLAAIAASSTVTRRIVQLRRAIKFIQLGHLDVRADVKGNDEIAVLAEAYNDMLGHLRNTVAELTESQVMQQEAVLAAMQSQISAHFLYNTLEMINSMAHLNDQPEIERVTIALSQMLRYTSDYKNTLVMLGDELAHLERYLDIMKAQFGGAIAFNIQVEDGCLEARCLKTVLQPIAENSIKHGIETTGRAMNIWVRVERMEGNLISITLQDNGRGFPEEVLGQLRHTIESGAAQEDYRRLSRIGLLNVHFRMRMFYRHPQAGIRVSNGELGGARVQLIFPSLAEGSVAGIDVEGMRLQAPQSSGERGKP